MKHFNRQLFLLLVLLVVLGTLAVGQSQSSSGDYLVYVPFIHKVDDNSYYPAISGDGRFVAFQSREEGDILVHDRQTAITERVSVNSFPQNPFTSISADGRYVAFDSFASYLVDGDTNDAADIFVHDTQTGTTERVSVHSDGTEGNNSSGLAAISGAGRYVAFQSLASNLVAGDNNATGDVFVHDREMGTTERVSVHSDGTQGNGFSGLAAISADGRYVAFQSAASNLVDGDTYGYVYGYRDVFVHDRQTGITERVSVHSDGTEVDDHSGSPAISADGRYVAFDSDASNLVDGDTNSKSDIFVHDTQTGTTERVSGGTEGNE